MKETGRYMLELNLVVGDVSDFFANWIIVLEYSGKLFLHFEVLFTV